MLPKEVLGPKIAVSRLSFGFVPDRVAFAEVAQTNQELGVHLGIEINPHRLATIAGYQELSRRFGVEIVGVHGPVYASHRTFHERAKQEFRLKHRKNAILQYVWLLGFGKTLDPGRRYPSPFALASSLGAYLVVHQETLEGLTHILPQWNEKVRILRENGWGPEQGVNDPLSFDPETIRHFADEHGIGTLLDTSAAFLTGSNILKDYRVMAPGAIHFADFDETTREENLVPGRGSHAGQLRDLVAESRSKSGVILTIEVWSRPNFKSAIGDSLNFIEGGKPGSETSFSLPGKPISR